ncbi:reverse transcriptase domain-containing protein [Tanacetum coccineum]
MHFALRNAGATYQRLVDKAFHKQIGRNLKVYVDDLVIKSRTEDEIVRDMEETFQTLRENNMKLNPKKCTSGIEEGMFLGKSNFYWTTEAEEAFKQMKQLIAKLPMLVAPMEKEEFIVYLAAAKETTQSIGQRADIGRLYSRMTRRGISGYSNGRRGGAPRTMDLVHEWTILHRRFRGRINTHKPERDRVYLRFKIQV